MIFYPQAGDQSTPPSITPPSSPSPFKKVQRVKKSFFNLLVPQAGDQSMSPTTSCDLSRERLREVRFAQHLGFEFDDLH